MSNVFLEKITVVGELSRKQIKTQYRGSFLGMIWSVLNPLLNMLVMWFVFGNIFNITEPYYPLYILTGNLMFSSLTNSTLHCLNSFVSNRGLLLRTKTSLYIFPLSNILASLTNFFFSLIALLPFMIWLSVAQGLNLFTYRLLFIFLMLPPFLMFEFGIGLFLGVIFVFFRDLKHIYGVFLTLWRYLTPLFYKLTRFKDGDTFLEIMKLNPMYHYVNYFRDCVYRGAIGYSVLEKYVGPYNPGWETMGYLYAFGAISIVIGLAIYLPLKNKVITNL